MAKNTTIGKIPYSLAKRLTNPSDKNSEKKIFATPQYVTVNSRQLANHWAGHTSAFSTGECLGIIEDLVREIREMLLDGYAVYLEGLGKLFYTLSSEGVDDAEKFNPTAHIKRVNVRFAPDEDFKAIINSRAQFELVATREKQALALKEQKETLNGASGGSGGDGGIAPGGDVTE